MTMDENKGMCFGWNSLRHAQEIGLGHFQPLSPDPDTTPNTQQGCYRSVTIQAHVLSVSYNLYFVFNTTVYQP